MMNCPFCGHKNIEGVDCCERCQESIDFLSRPQPGSEFEKSLLTDRVFMLAPRQPVTVPPTATVEDVLDLLVEQTIGCVLVCEGEELLGIFSERDALVRVNVEYTECLSRPIGLFMTPHPETIDRDARIAFALHKMDIGGYRHMPVTTDGRVSGVISIRDILDYITAHLLSTVE